MVGGSCHCIASALDLAQRVCRPIGWVAWFGGAHRPAGQVPVAGLHLPGFAIELGCQFDTTAQHAEDFFRIGAGVQRAVGDAAHQGPCVRGIEASLVTAMGRMAAHTGKIITRKMILESTHDFAPNADKLTMDGPAPIQADKDGKYAVPEPGRKGLKEF